MGDCVKTKRFLMQNFLLRHRFAVTFFAGICIGTGYANMAYRYQAALPEITISIICRHMRTLQ